MSPVPVVEPVREDGLIYLRASHIHAAGGVFHCFTTRRGGVSRGRLESLNLGTNRGDERDNVLENYEIICSAIGADYRNTVFSRQTHGDHIFVAEKSDAGRGLLRPAGFEADAYLTCAPGVVLTVFTADCVPILLYDPVKRVCGAVHAGWRGTANGVLYKTLALMVSRFSCQTKDILAAVGPCIGMCCFETDHDVPEAMFSRFGARAHACMERRGEKWHVNLKGLNVLHLAQAGILQENIAVSGECTCCNGELFWSYRRDGESRGSQAAMISLAEG